MEIRIDHEEEKDHAHKFDRTSNERLPSQIEMGSVTVGLHGMEGYSTI